jgi:hypothetical protein
VKRHIFRRYHVRRMLVLTFQLQRTSHAWREVRAKRR